MIDRDTAEARVKMASVLKDAGYDERKSLRAIRYPQVMSVSVRPDNDDRVNFALRPDDDYRLVIADKPKTKGVTIADGKRNVNEYDSMNFSYNVPDKQRQDNPLEIGKLLLCATFDGWRNGLQSIGWQAEFSYYGMQETEVRSGGRFADANSDDSAPPLPSPIGSYYDDPPTFHHYYDNGFVAIPPPKPWPYLPWRKPDIEESKGDQKRIE